MNRVVDRDPELAQQLANSLGNAADEAARQARTLLVSLREGQTDRPTVDVIGEVAQRWGEQTGVRVQMSAVAAVDAAPAVTSQMAAALAEILQNVAKHAGATQVEVVLRGQGPYIVLSVSDDGQGFDPSRAPALEADGHFGLRGLRERAAQVGGEVEITTGRGEGTTVRWTALRQPPGT